MFYPQVEVKRKVVEPPPIEEVTITISGEQARMLRAIAWHNIKVPELIVQTFHEVEEYPISHFLTELGRALDLQDVKNYRGK